MFLCGLPPKYCPGPGMGLTFSVLFVESAKTGASAPIHDRVNVLISNIILCDLWFSGCFRCYPHYCILIGRIELKSVTPSAEPAGLSLV